MNLKHLTYEILIFTKDPNSHSGVLQLAQYLAFAPQLETLELHVSALLPFLFLLMLLSLLAMYRLQ